MLPGILGSLQAMEAIKLLLGAGEPPLGRLLHYDALNTAFREFKLRRDPECPLCGENPTVTELVDYQDFCGISDPTIQAPTPGEISVDTLKSKLASPFDGLLLDVRETWEHDVANIEHARLVPMAQFPSIMPELQTMGTDKELLILCKSGMRSGRVVEYLKQQGFTNAHNVTGGMDAWLQL